MASKKSCDYIEIERRPGSLEYISDFIQEMSMDVKLGFKKTWELMLVIDEICSNILFNSDSSDNTLKITWDYDGNCIKVEIIDIGFPYNPLDPSQEDDEISLLGAMGTHMIEKMVDKAEYSRKNETNRTCIEKYRRKPSNKISAGEDKNEGKGNDKG